MALEAGRNDARIIIITKEAIRTILFVRPSYMKSQFELRDVKIAIPAR